MKWLSRQRRPLVPTFEPLAYMRGIPKVLANQSEVEVALSEMGHGVGRISAHQLLQFRAALAKTSSIIHLWKGWRRFLLILNASGDCIASASFPEEASPVGLNLSDRQYFQLAKREWVGRQFAISRSTGLPGIYYYLAAVRVNVVKLSVVDKNTFIADETASLF